MHVMRDYLAQRYIEVLEACWMVAVMMFN